MSNSQLPNTSTNDSMAITTRGTALMVVESCIFILLDFAALAGNSLVCLAFCRKPSLRTVTNYFVLSLALADLSIAVSFIPLNVSGSIANKWISGYFGCKVYFLCFSSFGGTSLLTVMLVAINRYLHVTRPALCRKVYSKKRAMVMAIMTWIITITVNIIMFFNSGIQFRVFVFQPAFCFQVFSYTVGSVIVKVVQNINIAVPSLVIVFCHVKIYKVIRHHNTAVAPSSQGGHSALGVEEVKMTRVLTAVVVGFYLCWLPVFIGSMLYAFNLSTENAIKYWNFYVTFPALTSGVINPVIYALMSQPFRKEFVKILRGH